MYVADVNWTPGGPQIAAFAAFAVVAALLTITPGVDTVLVMRTALVAGRRRAMLAALGVLTGLLLWACAAGLGVAALLAASETAYQALRIGGALYLAGLGVRMLWRAGRPSAERSETAPAAALSSARAYSQGLLTNLLNPKVGVFYLTLLPQFVVPDHPFLLISLGLALVHVAEGVLWFLVVSWLAVRVGALLRSRQARRVLDAITGTVFLGFATRLALEHRA